ncbi:MAG: hypothetical protein RI885_2788 [Actinomycetota bacterium]
MTDPIRPDSFRPDSSRPGDDNGRPSDANERAESRSFERPVAATPVAAHTAEGSSSRETVVEREKEEFGGMKFGSAFFGWLTAMGMAIILTALLAATGAAIGLGSNADPNQVAADAAEGADTIGLVGGIVLAIILFVAYYCGGYVAGRMARFSGAKQGIAVWLWAVVIAIVLALIGLIAGSQFDVLANLNGFPRIPLNEGALTLGSIITVVVTLVVTLGGAILGGLAGMVYHRKVDRAGLGR